MAAAAPSQESGGGRPGRELQEPRPIPPHQRPAQGATVPMNPGKQRVPGVCGAASKITGGFPGATTMGSMTLTDPQQNRLSERLRQAVGQPVAFAQPWPRCRG